jgi:hypothetical protein
MSEISTRQEEELEAPRIHTGSDLIEPDVRREDLYTAKTKRPLIINQVDPNFLGLQEIHYYPTQDYGLYGKPENRGVKINRGYMERFTITEAPQSFKDELAPEVKNALIGRVEIEFKSIRSVQVFINQNRARLEKLGIEFKF